MIDGIDFAEDERNKQITTGDFDYRVTGTITFDIAVENVSSTSDAERIIEALELTLSPWAQLNGEVMDQEIEVDDIEDLSSD